MRYLWFKTRSVYDAVEAHVNNGGTHIFLDEVHYYDGWETLIKNLSMYNIGGVVAGLIFGKIYAVLKRKTIPVFLILVIGFLALGYFGKSVAALMVAIAGCSISLFVIWPAIMVEFNDTIPPQATSAASGVFVALLNVGCFVAAPYVGVLQSVTGNLSPRFPAMVGTIGVAIISVIWIVSRSTAKKAS